MRRENLKVENSKAEENVGACNTQKYEQVGSLALQSICQIAISDQRVPEFKDGKRRMQSQWVSCRPIGNSTVTEVRVLLRQGPRPVEYATFKSVFLVVLRSQG